MEENNIADNVAHTNAAAADEKIQIPVNETETALPFEIDCSDTNQVTLAFFTNPSYYNTLKRAKKEKMPKDDKKHREEIKFPTMQDFQVWYNKVLQPKFDSSEFINVPIKQRAEDNNAKEYMVVRPSAIKAIRVEPVFNSSIDRRMVDEPDI